MEARKAYTDFGNSGFPFSIPKNFLLENRQREREVVPKIVFLSTYPPRQCGIATYTQDLLQALKNQFVYSFRMSVCALETNKEQHSYEAEEMEYVLNTSDADSYESLLLQLNSDPEVSLVVIQHEFGLFADDVSAFNNFLTRIKKPVSVVFHTVLPRPDEAFKKNVQHILDNADGIIVMTANASEILTRDYIISEEKIAVIPHGTHLVQHLDKEVLKKKYGVSGRTVLSTFGLLSSGKSIETTLEALPTIIKTTPDVLFLILGKTHPTVVLNEGEAYRDFLKQRISELNIGNHVQFVNEYLALDKLLEYLQLTDVYLFTSKDPNQAVSGTFSYALSCGCPVVSTPIPHAQEFLSGHDGLTFGFGDSEGLAKAVNRLIFDVEFRNSVILDGMHKISATAWENSAVKHAKFFQQLTNGKMELHYKNPEINLSHIKKMTTDFGMLQFSVINKPDINSGYTIDDNARAMIAMCQHFKQTLDASDLKLIQIYLDFIGFCERKDSLFMNYVDFNKRFTEQNNEVNLEDSSGRAFWALGYLLSQHKKLPADMMSQAAGIFERSASMAMDMHSPRAMSFMIKGFYYYDRYKKDNQMESKVVLLSNRLVQMYRHEASPEWNWFESYLTYANSILPEALLCAFAMTGNLVYRDIAKKSFDFLLSKTFCDDGIKVISNRSWFIKGEVCEEYGEQPIDIAYTVITLRKFHDIFKERQYLVKMELAFNWFLGNNHLKQIIYNPCTGGCYDGLEEHNVNLNQGAESTVSYLMARLTVYKFFGKEKEMYHRRQSRSYKELATI
ncbi:glycosyltransferase [Flavobacterium silvaticum]|uniref:Glycosyltransferase n=1 Tax=Flavobacterium silvaticum TaxID=1852020 RepID=A0A972FKS4_9FLAO|nr:glycosyltransferase [Flavobacterium silvaticum]NMH27796.1 glycosyltransferase [Flavobacterium silvaticum]